MKKILSVLAIIFIFFLAKAYFFSGSKHDKQEHTPEKISCWRCGKDLTDDYNRIATSTTGYACTPCYSITMDEVHEEMRAEGYHVD